MMTAYRISSNPRYSFQLKLLIAAMLIAAGDIFFFQSVLRGAGTGIFALIWTIGAALSQRAIWRDKRAMAALAMAVYFACIMIADPGALSWALFWVSISMAVLLPSTADFDDSWRWAQRLVMHAIWQYIAPFRDIAKARKLSARRGGGLRMGAYLHNLVMPVIGSFVILMLFAYANPVIADYLGNISLPDFTIFGNGRLLLWACILVVIWVSLRPKAARCLIATFDGTGDRDIPGVNIASVRLSLIAFNLLFAGQNLLDIIYLWTGQGLPEGMSFTEYVHRGAYPLIATALLAGLFVLITLRPGSATAKDKLTRALLILWIAQNMFLVASSIERTLRYIDIYMMTELRIAALMWMGLVAVGLLLICWRMFAGRKASWLINWNVFAASIVLVIASFVDIGAVAARWNISHASEVGGKGVRMDLCYMSRLGPSSLLALVDLEQTNASNDPVFQDRVRRVRQHIMDNMAKDEAAGYWTWRHASRLKAARERLGEHAMQGFNPAIYDCGGWPIREDKRESPEHDIKENYEAMEKTEPAANIPVVQTQITAPLTKDSEE